MSSALLLAAAASSEGEEPPLPEGWKKKQSKSNPSKSYFISPSGQTQWSRPLSKAAVARVYHWALEIQVEFGPGRLGVGLREIAQQTDELHPEFQAEVENLVKGQDGRAFPAELYNWSVKPDKHLKPGMRITAMDSQSLAGCTYAQVVERLRKSVRPVKISFADVARGLVDPEALAVAAVEKTALVPAKRNSGASAYYNHKQLSTEYKALLVLSELHKEAWLLENQKLLEARKLRRVHLSVAQTEHAKLQETYDALRKEHKKLTKIQENLQQQQKQLKLQAQGLVESKEMARTAKLGAKNTALAADIASLSQSNGKLKAQRDKLQRELDQVEANRADSRKGAAICELTVESLEALGIVGPKLVEPLLKGSVGKQVLLIKEKLSTVRQEVGKEEARVMQVTQEIEQLTSQMQAAAAATTAATTATASSAAAKAHQPQPSKNDPPGPTTSLEHRIATLRGELHNTVTALAQASRGGDTVAAHGYAARRLDLKKELNFVQEQLRVGASSSPTLPTMKGLLDKCPSVTHEGGLLNNMKSMRGARERWCQLDSNGVLAWFKRRGDSEPRGQIDMREDTLEIILEDELRREFLLTTALLQVRFVARSPPELANWLSALRTAQSVLQNRANRQRSRMPESGRDREDRATIGFN